MAAMYKLPVTALPGLTAIPIRATTTVLVIHITVVRLTAVTQSLRLI